MIDMCLERSFDPPLGPRDVAEAALESRDCARMHGVEWRSSFLSTDGARMLCWLQGPDLESARLALRQTGADMSVLWHGSVHDRPGAQEAEISTANVLVERRFDEQVTLGQIQEIEDAGVWCLDTRKVRFMRTFFSADQRRMLCLYQAPDAESVRLAQRQAGVPFEQAWAFKAVRPEHLPDLLG